MTFATFARLLVLEAKYQVYLSLFPCPRDHYLALVRARHPIRARRR